MLIKKLETQKNLLAFSGGVDSTSLFFILLENNIPFDIAIVDYNQREQSKQEIKYAITLAQKYNKMCYVKEYQNNQFSEKLARDFRYDFFDSIMKNKKYETLITAHQLNDKLEWFLMQLSRGAGMVELIGLEIFSRRKNYTLFRPLLEYSKDELLEYLQMHKIHYFLDESNSDIYYKRNLFRQKYANDFIKNYKEGIKKSFEYISNDIKSLRNLYTISQYEELYMAHFTINDINIKIRAIDDELKKRGIVLSKKTKDLIIEQKECVVSHKIVVVIDSNTLFITPFVNIIMDKQFKEWCRIHKIPKKIRNYLFTLPFEIVKKIFV